ncbi:nucleoside deaminase [Candidatus Margulisiibacteriota bacterium]
MAKSHHHFMSLALREAASARDKNEVPVGAVLVNNADQQVIASAHNLCLRQNDPTAHAELLTLQQAASQVDLLHTDLTLYVTLEPCPMCAGAIIMARVNRVVYGADDPKAGACGSVVNLLPNHELDHVPEVIAGINDIECGKILKDFFKKLRD